MPRTPHGFVVSVLVYYERRWARTLAFKCARRPLATWSVFVRPTGRFSRARPAGCEFLFFCFLVLTLAEVTRVVITRGGDTASCFFARLKYYCSKAADIVLKWISDKYWSFFARVWQKYSLVLKSFTLFKFEYSSVCSLHFSYFVCMY